MSEDAQSVQNKKGNGGKYQPKAKGAPAHRLQNPKWPMGSGKVRTPRFLGILSNIR